MKKGCRVLLSLMQLDIGGAETHVVELAKELKRRGAEVFVTSNGGAYETELEEYGIKHYKVPLQNKNPMNVVRAFDLLKKIITDEKIDIVHSHARIPSFILGKLHKKMKFPFVTTAHWVFNTKYGLKYITDWGQQTVAVSEDIKTYLMDNYNIPAENIVVTINGIDLDKFSPQVDKNIAYSEFGLSERDFIITYVSRMDEDRSYAAKELIKQAPELKKDIPNLKILVVGGGNDYDNVKSLSDIANQKCGEKTVILTGARTDINSLIAPADIFVGVSRAALEAMAAEKAVVIAGNEGYIGLFDEGKLDVGIKTNFCCRGCEKTTGEVLKRDILKFYNMTDEEKEKLGKYGRELIRREYSVERMTNDTVIVYDRVLDKADRKAD